MTIEEDEKFLSKLINVNRMNLYENGVIKLQTNSAKKNQAIEERTSLDYVIININTLQFIMPIAKLIAQVPYL